MHLPFQLQCGFRGHMSKSRRQFLVHTSLGVLCAAVAHRSYAEPPSNLQADALPTTDPQIQDLPPGAPSAFGTGLAVGPEVSPATFAEAEKLVRVELSDSERAVAAGSWRRTMAALYERRTGPRKLSLEPTLAPWSRWDPVLPGQKPGPERDRFLRSASDPGPLPARDEDVGFASVTQLSRWIETRKLSSERLTRIYLERLRRFDPKLHCVITLTPELADRKST